MSLNTPAHEVPELDLSSFAGVLDPEVLANLQTSFQERANKAIADLSAMPEVQWPAKYVPMDRRESHKEYQEAMKARGAVVEKVDVFSPLILNMNQEIASVLGNQDQSSVMAGFLGQYSEWREEVVKMAYQLEGEKVGPVMGHTPPGANIVWHPSPHHGF